MYKSMMEIEVSFPTCMKILLSYDSVGPRRALSFNKTLQGIDLPSSISPVSRIYFRDVSNSPVIFTLFILAKGPD